MLQSVAAKLSPILVEYLLALTLFLAVCIFGLNYFSFGKTNADGAVVGPRNEVFSWVRATLRSPFQMRTWAFDGYRKYSKSSLYFTVPSIDQGAVLVIPPRHIRDVYNITDKRLDVHDTGNKTIQAQWTIWDKNIYNNAFHIDVIRNRITKNLDIITPPIALELKLAFEREWGTSTSDWKEVRSWASSLQIVAGAANGAFCGPPLCRNPIYLKWLQHHATCLFGGSLLINCTPKPFKSVVGAIVGWAAYYAFRKAANECMPIVQERLRRTALLKADPTYDWVVPRDGLQWIIDECYATGDSKQLEPSGVSHRLIFLNDISMYSTAFTMQNAILDLASADPSLGYMEALREECATVFEAAGGSWTREAVTKLKLVDSTIRESMRLRPFSSIGAPRTVIDPHGVTVPQGNSSIHLPLGARVALPIEPIHHDESIYPGAECFRPFRFAQPGPIRSIFENEEFGAPEYSQCTVDQNNKPKSSVSLDDSFLGFGFGRSACPGRFFVMNEVKIFMAEMILNYDLDYLRAGRPKLTPVIWLNVPLNDGRIRVRRRVSTPKEHH